MAQGSGGEQGCSGAGAGAGAGAGSGGHKNEEEQNRSLLLDAFENMNLHEKVRRF
jgi:hypothetical protein